MRSVDPMTGMTLCPEYREPEDQQHQEDHDEDVEQETGDVGGGRRNAGEAEDPGDHTPDAPP